MSQVHCEVGGSGAGGVAALAAESTTLQLGLPRESWVKAHTFNGQCISMRPHVFLASTIGGDRSTAFSAAGATLGSDAACCTSFVGGGIMKAPG